MWDKYKHIVPHIAVGAGTVSSVTDWVCSEGYRNVLVVSDPNTYRVAGERVVSMLRAAPLYVTEFCFEDTEPLPDEHSVGRILAAFLPDTDLILGVGSGTINDMCTFVGARVGCPSAIVATAPSMDGYASKGSSMLFNGIKVTPMTECPVAIFCDTDILAAAPMRLIVAGLGDMLGKITSLMDWRLSNTVTGEPMPTEIAEIVEDALGKVIAAAPKALMRDPIAIESVTEGLILSGISMSLYGDSRPASGTEHHLAHYWEMRELEFGRVPSLHGARVGFATVVALEMWQRFGQSGFEPFPATGMAYRDIGKALSIISAAGVPSLPRDVGVSLDVLRESILYAKERKKTYTLLWHLEKSGQLEEYADYVVQRFTCDALSGARCFVLDMDGTIYLGSEIFPYTLDFLRYLDERGLKYVFFTNNSSQNAAHYLCKLRDMGIEIDDDKLLMSTHVLLDYLKGVYAPRDGVGTPSPPAVFVAGTQALKDDILNAGYTLTEEIPDFCVLGFDMDIDYIRLAKLCNFAREGVPLYGVNIDLNCPTPNGFVPDCGSLSAALTASTGVVPEFFGKPSRRALDYIIRKTGYREEELCFVGDRLYTDIAITGGTKTRSVLVLSGETKREDLKKSPHIPDLVVDDLRELMESGFI